MGVFFSNENIEKSNTHSKIKHLYTGENSSYEINLTLPVSHRIHRFYLEYEINAKQITA